MSLTLKWGLQPPPEAIRAWGARAIYETRPEHDFSLLPDRQDYQTSDEFEHDDDRAHFMGAIRPLNWLHQHMQRTRPGQDSDALMVHSEPYGGEVLHSGRATLVLEASPRRSFGYVFIVVYELPRGVQPRHADTPTPPPPAKRRARSRVRINQFTGRPSPR